MEAAEANRKREEEELAVRSLEIAPFARSCFPPLILELQRLEARSPRMHTSWGDTLALPAAPSRTISCPRQRASQRHPGGPALSRAIFLDRRGSVGDLSGK